MSSTIQPGQLQDAVNAVLKEFVEATSDVLDEAAKVAGDHAAETLHQTSPKRSGSGAYAKGWAVKVDSKAKRGGRTHVIVYNRDRYQLAHLLENGHSKALWGRKTGESVPGKEHIKPVEEKANEEFLNRVRAAIGK